MADWEIMAISQSGAGQNDALSGPDGWMMAMRRGNFALAWQISDAHLRERLTRGGTTHAGPRHLQYVWNGNSLAGKRVLVRCYHGLGDTVQFIRFVAPLRRAANAVIVWAQPRLLPIVRTAPGVDHVLPLHDGAPDAAYDADIEIMELAHALRVDAQTIPCSVPYLFPRQVARRPAEPRREAAIGLVWQAGDWDPQRSMPASLLSPLSRLSYVRLFSLQHGSARRDADSIPAQNIDADDIEELAAILCGTDLLITVDTFAAHLAGALGVPVWLLLHAQCDWRWMEHGSDSIWYPTMRLFRQPRPGDWQSVVEAVMAALRKRLDLGESLVRPLEQTIGRDVRSR